MIFSRRDLLRYSLALSSAISVSTVFTGCARTSQREALSAARFTHGVASGDPQADALMLWTRVEGDGEGELRVAWELASDPDFNQVLRDGEVLTGSAQDNTVKVDVRDLAPGTEYFYRFLTRDSMSPAGRGKTLPEGRVDSLRMGVFSCSNYPAGYFHAYREASELPDVDVFLHLGDYFYEYGMGGYATDRAEELGRALPADNAGELYTLQDYRRRYALYRSDADLQAMHAAAPMIAVWDDHEIANDTWLHGAQNHSRDEGEFEQRKAAAIQAYFEWLPLRPVQPDRTGRIYRRFDFGDLLSLHMLDTRLIGRDRQLEYAHYIDRDSGQLDSDRFREDISDGARSLLGMEQREWLYAGLADSSALWQVLGQQVLMARMTMPVVLLQQMFAGRDGSETQALIAELVADKQAQAAGQVLPEERAKRLRQVLPYSLDAWDGYPVERERLYAEAKKLGKQLVVLAGDTHNAWASELRDMHGDQVGVEYATHSVSSPGMETYMGLTRESGARMAQALPVLIEELQYCQLTNRGFMELNFSRSELQVKWHFLDDVTVSAPKSFSESSSLPVPLEV